MSSPVHWKIFLVEGFIRDITQSLTQITPNAINGLCYRFFYTESIKQLKEKRNAAKKANDLEATFEIEQCILREISYSKKYSFDCEENANKLLFNQEILREVLNHWIASKKLDEFRENIIKATLQSIQNDNVKILKIILKHGGYDQISNNNYSRNNEIIEFIDNSAKYSSFDCIKLLLKSSCKLNWCEVKRPMCLFNAIQFHSYNMELINFIMDKLESLGRIFVCDDIMKQVIKNDLAIIARRIIDNRWHIITNNDELDAKKIDGDCHRFFAERARALNLNCMDRLNQNDDIIDLDDDEWGDNNEESDFDEDDDW